MKCFNAALTVLALVCPAAARAELTGTPFVEGLQTPTKIVMTRGGNLLVSEGGNPPPRSSPTTGGSRSWIAAARASRSSSVCPPASTSTTAARPAPPACGWPTATRSTSPSGSAT